MIEEIKVIPPRPGCCRLCAVRHRPEEPHDRDSLYYQNGFYKKYRRFPTWDDAMAHCTEEIKTAFRRQHDMT
jgi:hypothetical protein